MKWILAPAVSAALLIASAGFAEDLDRFSDQYGWLFEGAADRDIFIATVRSDGNPDATNANPPVVDLQVEEVLRGAVSRGPLTARWIAQPRFHCGNETQEQRTERLRWLALPLPGPKRGSRWILGGYPGTSGSYVLHHDARYGFDPDLAEWLRTTIAGTTEESPELPR